VFICTPSGVLKSVVWFFLPAVGSFLATQFANCKVGECACGPETG
jgi:hypothetical protein